MKLKAVVIIPLIIVCLLQLGIRITISVEKEPLGTGESNQSSAFKSSLY